MNKYFISRVACPGCGQFDSREIYRISYTHLAMRQYIDDFYGPQGEGAEYPFLEDQDFIVNKCSKCEMLYQKEIPGAELMHRLYDIWINPEIIFQNIEANRHAVYFKSISDEIYQISFLFNKRLSDLRMLDFSMGWGHWCRVAASFGIDIEGTEFSQARLAHAHQLGLKTTSPFELQGKVYDFINAEQVFEHLPDPIEELKMLANALTENGVLKFSVPNGRCVHKIICDDRWRIRKGLPSSLNPIAPLEHINCFNEKSIIKLAARAGLKQIFVNDQVASSLCVRLKEGLMPYYSALRSLDFTCWDVRRRPALRLFFTREM